MVKPTSPTRYDFNLIAAHYDRWYDGPRGAVYDRLEKRAVAALLAGNARGARLLDVGSGTGHWAAWFSARGFRVTAVDISIEMTVRAVAKRIPTTDWLVADGHALPFADGSFDVVSAMTTLEFVRDPERTLSEMERCARRPGGTLLVGALNRLSRLNRRRMERGKEPYRSARLFSPAELRMLLERLGQVRLVVAAFVPRWPWALRFAPVCDTVGRALRLQSGDFIAARVVL